MGVPLLNVAAVLTCVHGGQAKPILQNPRVKAAGANVVTITCVYSITGCSLPPEAGGPCVTATWVSGATRVTAGGMPVLLQNSQATCVPTGTPLQVVLVQPRVTGE
jgi:hypothetical protein